MKKIDDGTYNLTIEDVQELRKQIREEVLIEFKGEIKVEFFNKDIYNPCPICDKDTHYRFQSLHKPMLAGLRTLYHLYLLNKNEYHHYTKVNKLTEGINVKNLEQLKHWGFIDSDINEDVLKHGGHKSNGKHRINQLGIQYLTTPMVVPNKKYLYDKKLINPKTLPEKLIKSIKMVTIWDKWKDFNIDEKVFDN